MRGPNQSFGPISSPFLRLLDTNEQKNKQTDKHPTSQAKYIYK